MDESQDLDHMSNNRSALIERAATAYLRVLELRIGIGETSTSLRATPRG